MTFKSQAALVGVLFLACIVFLATGDNEFSRRKLIGSWEIHSLDGQASSEALIIDENLNFKYWYDSDVVIDDGNVWPKTGRVELVGNRITLPIGYRFHEGPVVPFSFRFLAVKLDGEWRLVKPVSWEHAGRGGAKLDATQALRKRSFMTPIIDWIRCAVIGRVCSRPSGDYSLASLPNVSVTSPPPAATPSRQECCQTGTIPNCPPSPTPPNHPMKLPALITALALPLLLCLPVRAETPAERTARLSWFNEARFGMFIHWGVYSAAAGNWNGKPVPGAGEWIQSGGKIAAAEYRSTLQKAFNPLKYDPEAWVLAAKAAGMKYIVITSKHHDGFCLWDSKLTDWSVASTPYQKDLLEPLAAACRKHGVKFCLYHSIMDWNNPDWGTKVAWRGNANTPNPDMDKFTTYLKGQLSELVSRYHPGILWFDGEWEAAWTHERGVDLYDYLRQLDPALIINNRVDKGRAGMHGNTTDAKFKGDYGTPEQEIPATGFAEGVVWESCMTMNDTWGFKASDTHWKSTTTLVRNLIDIASKGGNYLLNVGPTGDGEIPGASLERLAAIGEWMKINGESIHGTTASVFPAISWDGRSTTRRSPQGGGVIYLHVFSRPQDGKLTLSGLATPPDAAAILGKSGKLAVAGSPGAWSVQLPENLADPIATVVALTFKQFPVLSPAPKPALPEPASNGNK